MNNLESMNLTSGTIQKLLEDMTRVIALIEPNPQVVLDGYHICWNNWREKPRCEESTAILAKCLELY